MFGKWGKMLQINIAVSPCARVNLCSVSLAHPPTIIPFSSLALHSTFKPLSPPSAFEFPAKYCRLCYYVASQCLFLHSNRINKWIQLFIWKTKRTSVVDSFLFAIFQITKQSKNSILRLSSCLYNHPVKRNICVASSFVRTNERMDTWGFMFAEF